MVWVDGLSDSCTSDIGWAYAIRTWRCSCSEVLDVADDDSCVLAREVRMLVDAAVGRPDVVRVDVTGGYGET